MATIKDVARLAGVNPSTVSRVFSGKAPVAAETAERVRTAAADLNFRFNRTARSLVKGSAAAPLYGIALPLVTHPFYMDILKGLQEIFDQGEAGVMIFNLGRHEERLSERILGEGLDGLILVSHRPSPIFYEGLERSRIPWVLVDGQMERVWSVAVDHHRGGALAARHLLNRGVRRPWYLGETYDSPQQDDRRRGFLETLAQAGVALAGESRVPMGETPALDEVKALLEAEACDGLFTYCDEMAYGAMRAFKEIGRTLPLAGYDDLLPSRYVGLSTVCQPALDLGRHGALMLKARLESDPAAPAQTEVLQPEFRSRGT